MKQSKDYLFFIAVSDTEFAGVTFVPPKKDGKRNPDFSVLATQMTHLPPSFVQISNREYPKAPRRIVYDNLGDPRASYSLNPAEDFYDGGLPPLEPYYSQRR